MVSDIIIGFLLLQQLQFYFSTNTSHICGHVLENNSLLKYCQQSVPKEYFLRRFKIQNIKFPEHRVFLRALDRKLFWSFIWLKLSSLIIKTLYKCSVILPNNKPGMGSFSSAIFSRIKLMTPLHLALHNRKLHT